MLICKICREEFEDQGDVLIHIAFGHDLVEDTDNPEGLKREDVDPALQEFYDFLKAQKT